MTLSYPNQKSHFISINNDNIINESSVYGLHSVYVKNTIGEVDS
jgi:hypothetical protein